MYPGCDPMYPGCDPMYPEGGAPKSSSLKKSRSYRATVTSSCGFGCAAASAGARFIEGYWLATLWMGCTGSCWLAAAAYSASRSWPISGCHECRKTSTRTPRARLGSTTWRKMLLEAKRAKRCAGCAASALAATGSRWSCEPASLAGRPSHWLAEGWDCRGFCRTSGDQPGPRLSGASTGQSCRAAPTRQRVSWILHHGGPACCSPHPRGAIIRNPPAVNTLKDAADIIGKGGISKTEEIVALAGVDLEPQLLKEWMANAGALLAPR